MSFHSKEIYLFLKKLCSFLFPLFLIIISTIVLTKTLLYETFNFNVGKDKSVLILGDSHTQCAIDDTILEQAINLSESADTYFYSYVKFKQIIKKNPQIKTVIIGYSYHNVTKNQDKWLMKESINAFKLPIHFFLFDVEDITNFTKINGFQLPKNAFKIIEKNGSHLYRVHQKKSINQFGIGGYLAINKVVGKNEKRDNKSVDNSITTKSTIDLNYLKKIYDLAQANTIKVVLLSSPVQKHIYQNNLKNYNNYIQFKEQHLSNSLLIDNSLSSFDYHYFADSSHLNRKGSVEYSKQLKNKI